MFADYVERELVVVDVIRELRYELNLGRTTEEMRVLTEAALLPYIGKVEVIVLASHELTLATLTFLQERYPEQKFVGFWPRLSRVLTIRPRGKRVMMLASSVVQRSAEYSREREELKRLEVAEVVETERSEWVDVEAGRANAGFLRNELQKTGKVDVVLMYCTDLHNMRAKFEEIYGWRVMVVDDYAMVFRETCAALGLRGVDGGRGRF